MNKKLFEYIKNSPTAYHACAESAKMLKSNGYTELYEGDRWNLANGGKYFVRRNGSSLIAFRAPAERLHGFMITASHSDSPCLKIKDNAALADATYTRLSTEVYGGPIYSTWLDRPLSVVDGSALRARMELRSSLLIQKHRAWLFPTWLFI